MFPYEGEPAGTSRGWGGGGLLWTLNQIFIFFLSPTPVPPLRRLGVSTSLTNEQKKDDITVYGSPHSTGTYVAKRSRRSTPNRDDVGVEPGMCD